MLREIKGRWAAEPSSALVVGSVKREAGKYFRSFFNRWQHFVSLVMFRAGRTRPWGLLSL
jgi:hypothetical protein